MLNNIGLPGVILIFFLVIVLPIFLMVRASRKKRSDIARIADALEADAKSKIDETKK
jgi:preprotein translocase subunit YajC